MPSVLQAKMQTNCTICFEPWTSSSEHRLVSLRCGHLFGRSCISRWLKGQNARCPQCNAHAQETEIINIYAKSLAVLDISERDKALEDLAKEVTARRNAEITAVQERIQHSLAVQECERLKKELMDAQKQLQEYSFGKRGSIACAVATIPVLGLLAFADVHPLVSTLWLGVTYSVTASCMWPSIPLAVTQATIGAAMGFVQIIGKGFSNLIVGQILGANEDPDGFYDTHPELVGFVKKQNRCKMSDEARDIWLRSTFMKGNSS